MNYNQKYQYKSCWFLYLFVKRCYCYIKGDENDD